MLCGTFFEFGSNFFELFFQRLDLAGLFLQLIIDFVALTLNLLNVKLELLFDSDMLPNVAL